MVRIQIKTPAWKTKRNTPERIAEWQILRWLMKEMGGCSSPNSSWGFDNDKDGETQFVWFKNPNDAMLFKLTFGEWVK